MNKDTIHILQLRQPPASHSELLASLTAIDELADARFNEDNSELLLTIEDEGDAAEVIQEVATQLRKAGGEIKSVKQSFPVMNMTCAACASS